MSDEPQNPPLDESGEGGKGETPLNLDNPRDLALLRRAIKSRWPIPDAERAKYLDYLHKALTEATSPRDVANIVKVLVSADAMNQADEHLDKKNKRMDEGKPTEIVRELRVEFDQ